MHRPEPTGLTAAKSRREACCTATVHTRTSTSRRSARPRRCVRNRDERALAFVRGRIDWRRAVRVKTLDGLEAPGLAELALRFSPDHRLPVWRKHEARTGIRHFYSVPARLIHVDEESLLHRMLMRPGLDVHAVLEKDVGLSLIHISEPTRQAE